MILTTECSEHKSRGMAFHERVGHSSDKKSPEFPQGELTKSLQLDHTTAV